MIKDLEIIEFIKSDGTVYPLQSPPSRLVLSNTGWGKPADVFSVSSGPYQHGDTPISYRLSPRTIQMSIQHLYRNKQEYWAGRSTLLSQLGVNNASPNAPIKGTLRRKYYQDDLVKTRCLDVFLKNGLVYEKSEDWQGFSVIENLEFLANNPVIYDPATKTSVISSFSPALVLPFTFPFILGMSYGTVTITYTGTWESYPTLTIVGPATDFYIENVSTGSALRLSYPISAGETVTFNLSYDTKTVTNNLNDNLLPYIRNSDLESFALQYAKIVTGGINSIYVALDGYAPVTTVTLSYTDKYYGI